jgi:hypothetical protein
MYRIVVSSYFYLYVIPTFFQGAVNAALPIQNESIKDQVLDSLATRAMPW